MMTSFSPPGLPSEFSLRMAFFFELSPIALGAPTAAVRPKAERMDPKRSAKVRREVGKFIEVLLVRFKNYRISLWHEERCVPPAPRFIFLDGHLREPGLRLAVVLCRNPGIRLVAEFSRYLQARPLNHGCELPQARNRHPHGGSGEAETRLHATGVIPNGRSHAANVAFVFLEVAGVSVLAHAIEFGLQLLQISH